MLLLEIELFDDLTVCIYKMCLQQFTNSSIFNNSI